MASLVAAICLLGFYTQAGLLFSYDIHIVSGLLLLASFGFGQWFARQSIMILALGFASILLNYLFTLQSVELIEQTRSFGLLALSLFAGYGLCQYLTRLNPATFSRTFLVIAATLVALSTLERWAGLEQLSDTFRYAIYPDWLVYNSDSRDLEAVGFIRPKVFTSEPSHVAKMIGLVSVAAAISTIESRTKLLALLLCGCTYFILGSAAVIAGFLAILADLVVTWALERKMSFKLKILLFPAIVFVTGLAIVLIYEIASDRFGTSAGQVEPSAYLRLIAPTLFASEAISLRPLLGFGLGADSNVDDIYFGVLFGYDSPNLLSAVLSGSRPWSFGNLHAAVLIQLGLVGTAVWLWLMDRFRRKASNDNFVVFWTYYLAFGLLVASVNSPLLWCNLFVVLAALRLRSEAQAAE